MLILLRKYPMVNLPMLCPVMNIMPDLFPTVWYGPSGSSTTSFVWLLAATLEYSDKSLKNSGLQTKSWLSLAFASCSYEVSKFLG